MALKIEKSTKPVNTTRGKKPASVTTVKTIPKAKVLVTKVQTEPEEVEEILEDTEVDTGVESISTSEPLCNVGYSAGITRNLGDFNSLKVQVSLHLPCTVDNIHNTFTFANEFVDDKINTVLESYE